MGAIVVLWLLTFVGLGSAIVLDGDVILSLGRYCDTSDGLLGICKSRDNCTNNSMATTEKCSGDLVCCRLPGEVSRKKCQEYSKIETSSYCPGEKLLVVEPKEFPHMAAIGYHGIRDNKWFCGGILISERFVLTAAQCVTHQRIGPPRRVRLGDLRQADEERDHVQQITVTEVISHPEYNEKKRRNDIALLKLSKNAVINTHVRPACLHTHREVPASSGVAVGWGKTKDHDIPTELLKVDLPFVVDEVCNSTYTDRNVAIFVDSMLCAGDKGRDTCTGDSGGPLQVPRSGPGCMADIVGITSFGTHVCDGSYPGVYTRVSNFVPWIESIVWQ